MHCKRMREPNHANSSFSAHCNHRDGDLCTHPDTPPPVQTPRWGVSPVPCGPACISATHCHVRELKP